LKPEIAKTPKKGTLPPQNGRFIYTQFQGSEIFPDALPIKSCLTFNIKGTPLGLPSKNWIFSCLKPEIAKTPKNDHV
jgi:hypothetical protein